MPEPFKYEDTTSLLNNIDLELLKKQKLTLLHLTDVLESNVMRDDVEGVISLLDSIHDLLEPIE